MRFKNLVLMDIGNGVKYLPFAPFVDNLENRVTLLEKDIAAPGLPMLATECLRGQRAELLILLRGLKDLSAGTDAPETLSFVSSSAPSLYQSPSGAES